MFSSLILIDNKDIQNSKKLLIYKATDLKMQYWIIIVSHNKSKILNKDVQYFDTLFEKTKNYCGHNFAQKGLFYNAPICSKAKENLKSSMWKIYDDFM